MAVCAKCGSQSLEFKEGVGKATGKPWKAWYCSSCKLMHGMNGIPWGDKKVSTGKPEASPANNLEKKIDRILAILESNFSKTQVYQKETGELETETTPF